MSIFKSVTVYFNMQQNGTGSAVAVAMPTLFPQCNKPYIQILQTMLDV